MRIKKAPTPAVRRYLQTVIKDRLKFYNAAQRGILKALNEQVKPVIDKAVTHYQSHSLEHLIKPAPIKAALTEVYKKAGTHFAKAQYESLVFDQKPKMKTKDDGDGEDDVEFSEADFNKLLQDFIADVGANMVTNITDSTLQSLKDYIAEAIKNNVGAAELASDLREHFADFNRVRSMLIARTEVARAQNFGTFAAGEMTDFDLEDTWVHAGSSKNDREAHMDADGQTIDRGDTFNIDDDYSPAYPHDGTGGADEECNCNCTFYSTRKGSKY